MASSWLFCLTAPLLLLLLCLHVAESSSVSRRCFTTIYSFGDSIADTGNLYFDDNTDNHIPPTQALVLNLPYGETFFHRPTGRCSNGRLIIDFFAEQMGIPMLKPYLGIKNGQLRDYWKPREGVNFAVAGATALDPSFFLDKGINDIETNYSLSVQLDWFMDLLPSICNSSSSGNHFSFSPTTTLLVPSYLQIIQEGSQFPGLTSAVE
ncbi:hypothetical protein PIB30_103234 [Stylosanthes scabra]|uniref:Uncharacterized protein n=1 Tax=Stylosanthes scabra TaxID=79078 RepID=A0ABU6TZC6_9FABA|nr:hypothetical protein [Stylosanthes scabra]